MLELPMVRYLYIVSPSEEKALREASDTMLELGLDQYEIQIFEVMIPGKKILVVDSDWYFEEALKRIESKNAT